ncbi:hypothetical protein [Lachnospira pectinoschiza]|uniref:Uncharacterized protein n=1 Tax=Lachnospira pectinoschiza TaxID=28052 RepID=A0A1G9X1X1_9FIRM|nr:hypothetical protein [Lachnospira pectinoschiza]SDM90456.1 hypothetical protein SAMN05216544_1422 [Lachnospira pectinoschiza]
MYNNEKKFENIGPTFEELTENEMINTDGAVTPTVSIVASAIGKGIVSGLVSGFVSCTIIITFD